MRVQTADFLVSAGRPDQFPRAPRPEVAFAGRSNVGKSSLINRLLNRHRLAHTSSTPGRTQTVNFYQINETFFFVDLPGYGYAKVPRAVQQNWWALVETYLTGREGLRGVIHLVDARHPPTTTDQELQLFLGTVGLPSLVVLTKADKVGRGERRKVQAEAGRLLGLPPVEGTVFASAETGEGAPELWHRIEAWLRAPALPERADRSGRRAPRPESD
jgi:GTP-binding protein